MKYQYQIYIPKDYSDLSQGMEWKSIRPTNGKPYECDTKREAEHMLDLCYGDSDVQKRVIEVQP